MSYLLTAILSFMVGFVVCACLVVTGDREKKKKDGKDDNKL